MRTSTLLRTGLATAGTAVVGSIATDPDDAWYRRIKKPSFQPPPAAFPIAWTALYADIAVTTAVALDQAPGDAERAALRKALAVNLVLNAGWSVMFWRSRRPRASTVECALLALSSIDLVRRVRRINPRAGAALTPYPAWCLFATALNGEIARLNPDA